MLFRVLGPLSVKGAGPALSALMVRRLLAALLCRPNECVALEDLVLALWGEKAPPTARRTLQVYIRRLRGALPEPRILHEPAGYRIVVKPGELDGRLPLALRLAGARLRHRPDWTPAQLAARLRDRRRLLGELRAEDRAVAATFALSYDQLTPDQQLAFRALGHHPGVVYDAHHVAAMLDITPEFGDELLNGLVEANLLVPTPSGYRMHDLLRAYAMAQNEPDGALHRLLDWYLHMADLFNTLIGQPYPRLTVTVQHPPRTAPAVNDGSALACLEFEHANLLPVIGESLTAGHPLHTWQLTCLLWRFWYRRGDPDVWVSASSKALEAARQLKDEQAEGTVLHFYGLAELQAGRPSQAIERLSEALALREHDGDPALVGRSLNVLGICHNNQAQYRQAKQYYVRSLQLAREHDDQALACLVLINIGVADFMPGNYQQTIEPYTAGLEIARTRGDRHRQGICLANLGEAYGRLGRYAEAHDCMAKALAISREVGDRIAEATWRNCLGSLLVAQGRYADGRAQQEHALVLARRGWRKPQHQRHPQRPWFHAARHRGAGSCPRLPPRGPTDSYFGQQRPSTGQGIGGAGRHVFSSRTGDRTPVLDRSAGDLH